MRDSRIHSVRFHYGDRQTAEMEKENYIMKPLILLTGGTGAAGNVNAAAIKTCLCVRDGHVYIVYIVKSHACLSKVGDKEFMKVGTGWSCNRLALSLIHI